MTRTKANYLSITTVCAVLLATAGIGQASPDLDLRANANAKAQFAPATKQSWPPPIHTADAGTTSTKTADAGMTSAAPSDGPSSKFHRNRARKAAAFEAETTTAVTEPRGYSDRRADGTTKSDAVEPVRSDVDEPTKYDDARRNADTTEPRFIDKNDNWDEPRRYRRVHYYDDEIVWRGRSIRTEIRRHLGLRIGHVGLGHIRIGRRYF